MADVVIIDASDMCRELLGLALENQGFSTVRSCPEEAAQTVRQAAPALIILDPGPYGGKGWVFLQRMRTGEKGGGPQVILISDQSGKQEVLRAAQLGIRDYMLKKRFSLAELLTRVRRHVMPAREREMAGKPPAAMAIQSPAPAGKVVNGPNEKGTEGRSVASGAMRGSDPARETEDRSAVREAAAELKLNLSTREQTLEKLDSAPLKTLPGVVAELISLVNSPRGTVSDVASILRRDPVLTARLLRVANSAGFTSQRARVGTVEDAVKNIGVTGVRNLVVNVGVFDAFGAGAAGGLRMTRVWQHCLGVAMLMEKLAPQDASIPPGSAYLVGLCHDLADIVLRQHFGPAYEAIDSLIAHSNCMPRLAQAIVFGLPYSELMTQLLTRLRLPPLITLPIEEFFERGERRSAPGAGSLLGRSLRALNVYAHGLMLAPGVDEPITPLTRTECGNTFGDAVLSPSDNDALRGEALATASVLAGLTSEQTQQMCEPLVPQQQLRVGYVRDSEYARLDPLLAFLRQAAREVEMLPSLPSLRPPSLAEVDALIVAAPRGGAPEFVMRDMNSMRSLLAGRPLPALYLAGISEAPAAPSLQNLAVHRLPISIDSLGQFLAGAAAVNAATKSMAA
jgi:HD-like signal output (HDOD) protein/CheY-like chemotaxis protein